MVLVPIDEGTRYAIYNINKGEPHWRILKLTDIVRVLYFFDKDRIIIATNGFVKKQQKTPRSEIELAKDRRSDYHRRKEAGTYE